MHSQRDPGAYNDAAACGNLNATYHAMHCGDVAIVKNGDYTTVTSGPTGQDAHEAELYGNPSLNSCVSLAPSASGARVTSNMVTIRGESQQGVVFRHIAYGTPYTTNAPHNLILQDIKLTGGIEWDDGSINDVWDHLDGGSFALGGNGNGDSPPNGGIASVYNDTVENSD